MREDEPAMITNAEEIELDTTTLLESAEPVARPSGTCWDEESDGGVDRKSGALVAGPSGSRRAEKVDSSLGDVTNVANIDEIHKGVVLAEQVRESSQLAS